MFSVADMNSMAASQCGRYNREETMRNKLTELSTMIDSYNDEFKSWMKQTMDLCRKRLDVIDAGRELLTKKQMESMLLNANVTFSGEARQMLNEKPLADFLPEFEADTGGHGGTGYSGN